MKNKCNHKKEASYLIWCNTCALIVAGPKPPCKWKHGDYALPKRRDSDEGPCKVLDSEMHLTGQATETHSWSECLIFKDGSGSASLYKKMKLVKSD